MRAFDGLAFAQPRSGLGRFPRCGGTELHEVIYLRRLAVALRKGMLRAIYDVMMTARATHAAFVVSAIELQRASEWEQKMRSAFLTIITYRHITVASRTSHSTRAQSL